MTDAGLSHKVGVSGGVLGHQLQVFSEFLFGLGIVDRSLDVLLIVADDRLDAGLSAELEELDGAVHYAVIGEGQGGQAQLHRPLHHCGQLGGTIQQAVVAVVVERDEGQGGRIVGRWVRRTGTGVMSWERPRCLGWGESAAPEWSWAGDAAREGPGAAERC